MPQTITRDTELTFGKHKGDKLRDVPTGYLKWYVDAGKIKDWVDACEAELEHRKSDSGRRAPKRDGETPTSAKKIADSLVELTVYCHWALQDMGLPDEPKTLEAAQKIAVTAAIQAYGLGIDVDAEMRPIVAQRFKERREQSDEIPF